MENLDAKTLVHVGVELVVIGGLTFWFQRKTSLQQEEINNLREDLNKAKEIINSQGRLLARHDQILSQITGGRSSVPTRESHHLDPVPQIRPVHPTQPNRSYPSDSVSQTLIEDDGEENIDNEELDNILKEELGNMHKSGEKSDEEFIELECNGDVCELKKTRNSTKSDIKKKRKKGKKER